MKNELDSVCPIFIRYDNGKIEQVGSGVLLQLNSDLFLLTAAHVIDWSVKGVLCIPCDKEIQPIIGYVSSINVPMSIDRKGDKLDFGYFKLDSRIAKKIHKDFTPATKEECWSSDNLIKDDVYSFTGFPVNKSKQRNNVISNEFFSYSGHALEINSYKSLGYYPETNIIISFRRKKSVNPLGQQNIPPHPRGISGGAIFRWPKDFHEKKQKLKRHIVGIGHTYISRENVMVGTKLDIILRFMSLRNPTIITDFDINFSKNSNSIPLFVGLAYYQQDEWPLLLTQFEDAISMHRSWSEWREAAETGIEHFHKQGNIMIPIEISAQEILDFCNLRNLKNTSQTRNQLVNLKLYKFIRDNEVVSGL